MKTITLLRTMALVGLMLLTTIGWGQVTIFTESMGTVGGTTSIATHEANNGFDNDDFTMTDGGAANSADIRATSVSSGYSGASGGANVFFTSTAGDRGFAIEGINVSNYSDLTLQFGYRKESASALPALTVDYWDGTNYINVSFSFNEAENAATGWYLSPVISLPAAAQIDGLKLRWIKSGTVSVRIDDVVLKGETNDPSFTVSPTTLSNFTYSEGNGPSESQTFSFSGNNLIDAPGNILIEGSGFYEVSLDDNEFSASLNVSYNSSILTSTPIYVRIIGGLSPGDKIGSVTINGGGANATVQCIGFVTADCPTLTFPFYENFTSPIGSKLIHYCWEAHSGSGINSITVQASSITYPGYLSSGIGNQATLTNIGEDVNHQFLAQTSGTIYISFLANITSATTTGDYFVHVGQSSIGTTYRGRIFVKKDGNDNLAFGIAQSSNTVNYSDFNYDLNVTYLIVLKFEIIEGSMNDVSSIYINPPLNMSVPLTGWISNIDASGADLTELGSIALRQGALNDAPSLILDGIRVSDDWADIVGESSAPALLPDQASLSGFAYIEGSGPSTIQSFTLAGENLTENITLSKPASYEISTEGGEMFDPETSITLIPDEGVVTATIYVRLEAGLSAGDYNENILVDWEGDNFQVGLSGSVTEAVTEPTNHVTEFAAVANSSSAITVTWADSDASAYLIKGSIVSFEAITDPVDGVPESNSLLVKNVAEGIESHQFTGLNPDTEYFFKIFPYNGSGSTTNYKTDAPVPQASATTLEPPPPPYADALLRPQQIDISTTTSQSAVLMEIGNYPVDDARYRLFSGSLQYNCWDGSQYVTLTSYAAGPQVPGTPTSSSKFWILFERGNNNSTAASYRDRLGPGYTSNYQTTALPAADAIMNPFEISLSIPFTGTYDLDVKYVVLGFDAEVDGNLITATSSDLNTGDFTLKAEDGTTIRRIEVRTVLDVLVDELTGTWPPSVPENLPLDGITLGENDIECYDATNNITVTNSTIGDGAFAEFRAGVSINFGEGFIAESGSHVIAVITDVYCSLPESMLASEEVVIPAEIPVMPDPASLFRVYPNPTAGIVNLEFMMIDASSKVVTELYNMMGERLLQDEVFGSAKHQINVSALPRGVYIIRIIIDGKAEMQKIIRQ